MFRKDSHFGFTVSRQLTAACLLMLAGALAGCSDSDNDDDDHAGDGGGGGTPQPALTGVFVDSPVAGLRYETDSLNGHTDAQGRFQYNADETVSFYIGDYPLGSAPAEQSLSPLDLVDGAEGVENETVNNIAVLLQTLDQDGDLNNGIQITDEIAGRVSGYADLISLEQPVGEFRTALEPLLDDLNAAEPPVFTDTDPRPRTAMDAENAREHLARSISPGKTVTTRYGELAGFQAGEGAWAWYGIPYAKPPVGELRWKPPVKPDAWDGVRQATAWADQSAQNPRYESFGEGGMSEDSLYLNVTAPDGYEGERLPVMVWFHGGGFAILTGNTKAFNNTSLPKEGVVVVTVNHRLGPFGYMAHPALTAESPENTSGNYGQLDLIAALEWVRDNIEAFGGDPANVTIFGESGGGGKVLSLINSPMAEGLFHKAIVQSGMAGPEDELMPVENMLANEEADGVAVAEALGVQDEEDVAAALRAIPWHELAVKVDETGRVFSPNVDGVYMLDGIRDSFEARQHNDVPIIAGANQGDTPALIEGLKWYMPWMAEHNESEVFAYVFDHLPNNWSSQGALAYHGAELVYVFDYPGSFLSHYLLGLTGLEDPVGGDTPTPQGFMANPPGWNPNDVQVTDNMRAMWANFARTGNPSIEQVDWPAYTRQNDTYLRISQDLNVETGLDTAFPEPETSESEVE
ncbi:carboxylesterase/lipase family protein [Pseudomonas profundi]|uniref:carboxylesterase/lipase family protein n=1 Tax=Pseudomonas profundi TaxID=1981513 RepID=UPI0012384515|nr:carboxylesterase family protein [Pseudomonas profundi]